MCPGTNRFYSNNFSRLFAQRNNRSFEMGHPAALSLCAYKTYGSSPSSIMVCVISSIRPRRWSTGRWYFFIIPPGYGVICQKPRIIYSNIHASSRIFPPRLPMGASHRCRVKYPGTIYSLQNPYCPSGRTRCPWRHGRHQGSNHPQILVRNPQRVRDPTYLRWKHNLCPLINTL